MKIAALIILFLLLDSNTANPALDVQQRELDCLATAIYHEARGEPTRGQVAVAAVIENRRRSGLYPGTYCGVVYQKAQFTGIKHARPRFGSRAWAQAMDIASKTFKKKLSDPTKGALWYFAHDKIPMPVWVSGKVLTVRINNHSFYKTGGKYGTT